MCSILYIYIYIFIVFPKFYYCLVLDVIAFQVYRSNRNLVMLCCFGWIWFTNTPPHVYIYIYIERERDG